MIDINYKKELLSTALSARIKEVTEYQVNIDNFSLAIEKIKNDESMSNFKMQLENLLESSINEQSKAKIMLEVIQSQLEK